MKKEPNLKGQKLKGPKIKGLKTKRANISKGRKFKGRKKLKNQVKELQTNQSLLEITILRGDFD